MAIEPEKLTVRINERESVTALLYCVSPESQRDRAGVTMLLGHGAGANQTSGFMRMFASGLAVRGFDAMTFNFLYTEQGRRTPDPKSRLESCYRAAIEVAREHRKLRDNRLVIGGKSMGGRIASQVAAEVQGNRGTGERGNRGTGEQGNRGTGKRAVSKVAVASVDGIASRDLDDQSASDDDKTTGNIAGLVLLGYPLHPPGKPDQLRDEHLQKIRAPMLFVQGSRDPFGTPDELRAVIKRLRLPAELHVVEGGDHSFTVLKSSPTPQQQVYEATMDETARRLKSFRAPGGDTPTIQCPPGS